MNDENTEHMTFDQVRKILKERNLRGSIKLIVKTYEDVVDDTSQTVTTGPTTEHSRTPSPQKPLSNLHSNLPASSISTTSTISVSSATLPNIQSPVYTFLPYTPPPSSDAPIDIPVNQTPAPSLNIFAPKPFRSTASINLDTPNNNEKNLTHSSPIEAFRKMLDPSNSINQSMKNETTTNVEQSSSPVTKSTSRDVVNTLLSNPTLISSNIIDSSLSRTNNPKPPPPPLTSVESLLHGTSNLNSNDQQRNESPIAQVRSSVEKQMNQLQQELLLGFPHTSTSREQRPVNIPIDFINTTTSKSSIIKSSSQDSTYQQNRTYANQNENTSHYSESNNPPRPHSSYAKRLPQDLPSTNRPLTAHSTDRTVNELRVNLSSPSSYQQQKKVSLQIDEKLPQQQQQQRVTNKQLHTTLNQAPKKSHYEDHSWITDDQRKPMITPPLPPPPPPPVSQLSSYNNGRNNNDRRSASSTSHYQDLQRDKQAPKELTMFHYGDHTDEPPTHHHHHHHHHQHTRSTQQQRDFDPSINRHHQSKHRTKSPIRTTINSNNNRVLSVSGKLRCSRCNDELGQGSAMVIESLGLYYHIECFRCFVCNIPLSSSFEGTDVRVRSNRLHCQNCFSDENGAWRSNV
jgi:hypothetical protein